jgi:phosphoglycolate phosphatase-like HAD superfamily hydrolase
VPSIGYRLMRTEALILDFDDTLIRMTARRWSVFEEALRSFGATENLLAKMNKLKGGAFSALVDAALPDVALSEFLAAYAARLSADYLELCPGVSTLLDWIDAMGIPAVVLSSSSRILIERDLELAGISDKISAVFGYEDVPAAKPSRLAVRTVLGSPSLAPLRVDHVLMVGDSLTDAAAARGNLPFVAVLSGQTSRALFEAADVPAAAIMASLQELTMKLNDQRLGSQ